MQKVPVSGEDHRGAGALEDAVAFNQGLRRRRGHGTRRQRGGGPSGGADQIPA